MYSVLICEKSLENSYSSIFPHYNITIASSSEEILDLTYENNYNLYIVNFYFYNIIKELKECGDNTTTIFIDDYYDILHLKKSFLIGDDYLIQPLILEELQIRVDYHYRKIFKNGNIIKYKNFFYHISSKQLYLKNDKIKISPNETKLLELFLSNLNKPVSKDRIYDTLQTQSYGSLRVYISKLKKIGLEITYDRANSSYTLS